MAIVQISQMTNRKGLQVDLPQLAGAELGWSVDQRRLFIGNGTLAEGAPVVGNTEILTEFSDILAFQTNYTYQGESAGYTVQTGPTPGTPISQSLQSWLDQYASVKDFGAVGDGSTDDTAAINRALDQLYCQSIQDPQIRRSLFFPAGVYLTSSAIKIPPYACLVGEGINSSIIRRKSPATFVGSISGTTLTVTSVISGTIEVGQRLYAQGLVAAGTEIVSGSGTTWIVNTSQTVSATTIVAGVVDFVAITCDNQFQSGVNIGTNGATAPQFINISNMGFSSLDPYNSIFQVAYAKDCQFDKVSFTGPLQSADLNTTVFGTIGVDFASESNLITNQIVFDGCEFSGTVYAVNTDQQIQATTFSNGIFNLLYQGVLLGAGSPVSGGPTGVRILGNQFNNIYDRGIVIGAVSLNASGYNIFYDVANHFNGTTMPAAPVIDINANNNISLADMFQRTAAYSTTYPQINLNGTTSIGISNSDQVQFGRSVLTTGQIATLYNNVVVPQTITSQSYSGFTFNYKILRPSASGSAETVRTGVMTVSFDPSANNLAYTDDFVENENTGIVLSASQAGTSVNINYTSSSINQIGNIQYTITRFA